jgi:hypothetical protein
MAHQRFCKVCRSWHDLDAPWPDNCLPERNLARSDLPTPRLIRDGLDNVWNPVDGRTYDSKSAYYSAVKAAGCEIAGNDSSITQAHEKPRDVKPPPGLKDALRQAWDQHS